MLTVGEAFTVTVAAADFGEVVSELSVTVTVIEWEPVDAGA
jgi:hypothetical protein